VKPFRYYLRVRYGECDAQKVVFNSRYSDYVDVSINEFLRAIGILGDFVDGHLDFQLVKQTIEWRAPARFDQVLELSIRATRLGNTSFTLVTEFRIADHGNEDSRTDRPSPLGGLGRSFVTSPADIGEDERVIAATETIYVLVDAKTLTKIPIPDRIRTALQDGARGHVTNHAGHLSDAHARR
jgi:acyl-CoA thioester hydrolase